MKHLSKFLCRLVLLFTALLVGGANGVMMAEAADLPEAGKTNSGEGGIDTPPEGIQTETWGRENADPDFYLQDIDKRIVKIRPMATPVDQISRYAKSSDSGSFEVKYYSVGTREIRCTTTSQVEEMIEGASTSLPVSDSKMFTMDDTIRVVGVPGITREDGKPYDPEEGPVPDLVLCVCGKDSISSQPTVYAVNGKYDSSTKTAILVPKIPSGTTLVRMGKACGELDVQTGRFNNIPTPETQYCQNFMIQVEQSTFDKIADKVINWGFTDLEEDGIYDMRLAMENTFLFGVKNKIQHTTKDSMVWFTGGIWWMAGKDIEVGHWDEKAKKTVISDDDLVDITKDLFVGTGIGNKRKVLLCGSEMLSAFSKIKSEKFRLKDTVEVWHLKFKSWDTDFGEILTIHHELFDVNGMSDYGFALDPEYLSKKVHLSWTRNVLDLKKAGIRNTDAVVLQEIVCLYLRYAKAHARMRLAQAPMAAAAASEATTSEAA